jgi:hypothetical protein
VIIGTLLLVAHARAADVDTDADADGLPDRYDPCPLDLTNAIVNETCADGSLARPTTVAPVPEPVPQSSTTPSAPATDPERARGRYRAGRTLTWTGIAALPVGIAAAYAGSEVFYRADSDNAQVIGVFSIIGGVGLVVLSPGATAAGVWGQHAALRRAACPRTTEGGDLVAAGALAASYVVAPAAIVGYPYGIIRSVQMDQDARACGIR